jgi:catalase (peroxidase I)
MSNPQSSPITFTRAELGAIAEGLAILIAENPDHDPAQRAMAKIREAIRRLNADDEEE